jgi:flagellar basal-body rod modification protein FlgD
MTVTDSTAKAVSAAQTTAAASSTSGSESNGTDFLTLLVAELQNQDPLEPLGPSEFMSQLAQLQSVTQLSSLNDKMTLLTSQQDMAGPLALLGRRVSWTDSLGQTRAGLVTGLKRDGDSMRLVVGGEEVGWRDVQQVG